MRVLLDHSAPRSLKNLIANHVVHTAAEVGWQILTNGALLKAAEESGYDVFVTCDRRIKYQQNLKGRKIGIVEIGAGRWSLIAPKWLAIVNAVNDIAPGDYLFVEIPLRPKRPPQR